MATTADAAPPELVRPGSPDWDRARSAWNLAVDQLPDAVALPGNAQEVARAVAWARASGLRVAVQSTGHGASARGGLEGSLLVNMSRMREVSVDPERRIARAEGGAIWQDVIDVASPHGLAALHGSAHDVGVAGYTLGGGLGWLARRHGLACNSVTAVEAVLPDGTIARAEGDDELLWAMRGGGGAFGVVTAIEFRLLPIAEVYAGWLIWPWERSAEVLGAWAEWCETVPEDITSVGRLLQLPPLPELPEPMRGAKLVVVEACCLGDPAEADRVLAPLRALGPVEDTFARMPAAGLARLHMDPPEPVPGIADGGLLDTFPRAAVEALVEAAGPGSGSPLLSVEVRHLGGALDRAGEGALAYLDGAFALFAVGLPMAPGMAEAIDAGIDRALAAMEPFGFGRRYLNFAERPCDARAAFDGDVVRRLAAVRGRVDPGGTMHPNHDSAPVA